MSMRQVSLVLVLATFTLTGLPLSWAQLSTTTDVSSTTSGSIKRLFVQNDKEQLHLFVAQNFSRLQESAAKGSGVVLNDYLHLMGCQSGETVLGKAIQTNYKSLFGAGQSQLVERTEHLIESNSELAQACDVRS
jgi:hypothetical protein